MQPCTSATRRPAARSTNAYRPPSEAICSEYRHQIRSGAENRAAPASTVRPIDEMAGPPTASGRNTAARASGPPTQLRAKPAKSAGGRVPRSFTGVRPAAADRREGAAQLQPPPLLLPPPPDVEVVPGATTAPPEPTLMWVSMPSALWPGTEQKRS